jgi:hypothetical protein
MNVCLTSAQIWDEWSVSRPDRFNPEERAPCTHWTGDWVGPRTGLDDVERRKILPLPGRELRPLGCPARSQSLYRLHCLVYTLQQSLTLIPLNTHVTPVRRLQKLRSSAPTHTTHNYGVALKHRTRRDTVRFTAGAETSLLATLSRPLWSLQTLLNGCRGKAIGTSSCLFTSIWSQGKNARRYTLTPSHAFWYRT